MKQISRKKAIQLIYTIAMKQFGWDREELHQKLIDWKYGKEPHLSQMTGLELHKILENLGKAYYFVAEPKYVLFLRLESGRCGVSKDRMRRIINNKFKVASEYQMNTKMVQGLTKAMKYYKQVPDKQWGL